MKMLAIILGGICIGALIDHALGIKFEPSWKIMVHEFWVMVMGVIIWNACE